MITEYPVDPEKYSSAKMMDYEKCLYKILHPLHKKNAPLLQTNRDVPDGAALYPSTIAIRYYGLI